MGDINVLVRSLRGFERGDVLLKEVRKELREPVPKVRKRIKVAAGTMLPKSGGLGEWVAATKITAAVTLQQKAVTIRLRGGRRSVSNLRGGAQGGQSDIRSIDRGRVRAPSWGRRYRGQWHTQTVPPGFFTKTAEEAPEWGPAIDRAIVAATGSIHG